MVDGLAQTGHGEHQKKILIRNVFAYVDRNFRNPVGLRAVAAALGHDAAYLTDTIRAATGRPVHRWIIERRQAEAEYLLAATDLPITAVARASGYGDSAYFARAFARATGQSPSRWRITRPRDRRDPLRADGVLHFHARVRSLARTLRDADDAARDETLLAAARTLATPLAITMNHRDPASGIWRRHGERDIAFRDEAASIPMLLHGCVAAELVLERSYFDFYRRIAQVRRIGGFYKIPLFDGRDCVGALCATSADPLAFTRERRYALEELARAYSAARTYVQIRRLDDAPAAARNPAPASPATSSGSRPIASRYARRTSSG